MSTQKKQKPTMVVFDIESPPLDTDQLTTLRLSLNEKHLVYLIGVMTLAILAVIFTIRVFSLDFKDDVALLKISLNIGGFMGLFSGISIKGNRWTKLHVSLIGMMVCAAAGLGASMLITLFIGDMPSWISSINILASALASMWLLTYYEETTNAISLMKFVNASQLDYIVKVSNHFDSLNRYTKSILQQGRTPVIGEYWVIRDWVSDNKE